MAQSQIAWLLVRRCVVAIFYLDVCSATFLLFGTVNMTLMLKGNKVYNVLGFSDVALSASSYCCVGG